MRNELNNIQWCPWCWDYLILWAIRKWLIELWVDKKDVVIVSWIWCSGKISQYIDAYAAETLHWRSIPFWTWVKLSNPNLKVICIWWDWDWYGIWLGHFLHACRRDIDITYLVLDNENYALTTGQTSPTTPIWIKTKSTKEWNPSNPFNPVKLAESAWCRFTREIDSKNVIGMREAIKEAIMHPWFSHLNIIQACPSWKVW
ncbi:MAG: hypothetical protein ACD_3C00011G0001 [uncultured bacterium (gcode 4)]|uniref:Thiamine pyrophosphate enzyme TPP-binding domain-containing protein n=1 Tax=uncultured bacterium (gcode 4) TaxID=1234023 RepID=K2FCK4_9BACT|nr:MAG: hypothetical protein ACD_3C00011G0001 [uncultured bacterium (gcode 4)]